MQGKKLKQIDIILENCEVITVPIEQVHHFYANNITNDDIWLNETTETLDTMFYTDELGIALRQEANVELKQDYENGIFDDCKVFDRLTRHNDITHIDLIFTDNTNMYLSVPYEEENPAVLGSPNLFQSSRMNGNGELEIIISNKQDNSNALDYCNDIVGKEGST